MNSKKDLIKTAAFVSIIALSVSAAQQTIQKGNPANAGKPSADAIQTQKTPAKRILFFINPNGYPCQTQLSILDKMKDSIADKATVTYIKTTVPEDRNEFYKYGIRGLPSIIITDKDGNILKRLTPGIQNEKTILAALK